MLSPGDTTPNKKDPVPTPPGVQSSGQDRREQRATQTITKPQRAGMASLGGNLTTPVGQGGHVSDKGKLGVSEGKSWKQPVHKYQGRGG